MTNEAIEAYKNTSFEAAPPLKILRMLYAGALRFVDQAVAAGSGPAFGENLTRADAIVSELRCALERDHAEELADQLESLYEFVQSRFSAAILEQSAEPLSEARAVLQTLKEAWDHVQVDAPEGGSVSGVGQ